MWTNPGLGEFSSAVPSTERLRDDMKFNGIRRVFYLLLSDPLCLR